MTPSKDRRRRRRRRRERRIEPDIVEMAQPLHELPVYELMDEEGVEKIHQASLKVLAEVGMDFYDQESRDIAKEHGAEVEGESVRFPPDLVDHYLEGTNPQFTQLARNPDNNVIIGGNHLCFSPVYGPPFVLDRKRGRRSATLEDFQNFIKLTHQSPYLHHSGGTIVEPTDLPVATRHLDMVMSHIEYNDKAFMGSVTSGENAADSVAMVEILFGEEEVRENPALLSLINVSSPRRFDENMLGAIKVYARARQGLIITPFILAGAMSPVTLAGTVVQQNAEALAGIVFCQMINPGTPVVYGSFLTNVNLRTGAPMFGTPESQIGLLTSAQMARRYNLPFRSGGMFASAKVPDAQAAYESVMTMLPTVLARVNFVLHAAGWLENGLTAGYEKFLLDCELLGMYHKFLKGLDLSESAMAMESLRSVPPGGHHLGTEHTMERFRTAFYRADLFDYVDIDQWQAEGSKDAYERASEQVQASLKGYEQPDLDPALREALEDYMSRVKVERGG